MLLNYFIVEVYQGDSLVGYVDNDYNIIGSTAKNPPKFELEYFAVNAAEIAYKGLLKQKDNKKIKVVVQQVKLVPQLDSVASFGPL